jgi:hypothetical protein
MNLELQVIWASLSPVLKDSFRQAAGDEVDVAGVDHNIFDELQVPML